MNPYLILILTILVVDWLLGLTLRRLDLLASAKPLPPDFQGIIDEKRYTDSQRYLFANTRFANLSELITTPAFLLFIVLGGFGFLDRFTRSFELSSVWTGLLFFALLGLGMSLISIPFSAYQTFVIEERFGFNRTRLRTFLFDIVKSWVLAVFLMGPMLWVVLGLFEHWGEAAWIWVWAAVSGFQLLISFLSPYLILPVYYRFQPLDGGELKDKITSYIKSQALVVRDVYTVDGSRRSSKANAFFAGFGKSRRIALFDTLLEKHPSDEIVSVLAHEVGHYKYRHVAKGVVVSIATTFVMCWLLSFFLRHPELSQAFGVGSALDTL